jgi:hypothetical protein
MQNYRKAGLVGAIIALVIGAGVISASLNSCAALNTLAGLSKIQFKLNNVQSVQLAGIDITNKHTMSDFGVMDGVNLVAAFSSGKFPLTFTLNVAAKNPNAATGATALNAFQVTDFPWRLLMNGQQTISGNIGAPVGVPGGGTTTMIPLSVSLDLKQFFTNQGYDQVVNMALGLTSNGGTSQLQLKAQPTISTPIGPFKYPSELTIVNTQFSN